MFFDWSAHLYNHKAATKIAGGNILVWISWLFLAQLTDTLCLLLGFEYEMAFYNHLRRVISFKVYLANRHLSNRNVAGNTSLTEFSFMHD